MGRGWKDIRRGELLGFRVTVYFTEALLEMQSFLSCRVQSWAAVLYPWLSKTAHSGCGQQQQRGERLFRGSVLPRVLCVCVLHLWMSHPSWMAPVGTGHVDSEAALRASLCSQLGVTHLLEVLSFPSLSPNLGLQKHRARGKPRAVFVPWGCPSWNLLLADTASSDIDTLISFGVLHCVYIF